MVDTNGPVEVASQGNERGQVKKVDQVVELAQYQQAGGPQETSASESEASQCRNSEVPSSAQHA